MNAILNGFAPWETRRRILADVVAPWFATRA
jgi:hypothetical protein